MAIFLTDVFCIFFIFQKQHHGFLLNKPDAALLWG